MCMCGVLGLAWLRVVVFEEEVIDVIAHGEAAGALGIILFNVNAGKF